MKTAPLKASLKEQEKHLLTKYICNPFLETQVEKKPSGNWSEEMSRA